MLLSRMFILSYTTICFFVKEFIFSNVYISVNTIFECLYMLFWLRKGSSVKYICNWQLSRDEQSSKMRRAVYSGRGVSHLMCTYALTLSLFMFLVAFCLIVSCFISRNSKRMYSWETVIILQQDQFLLWWNKFFL